MPLCGSSFCGCAITSVPVVAGEGWIDGAYPSIVVEGNGTGASPWVLSLNDEWAGAVAAKFRGIKTLQGTGTTTATGELTFSLGDNFALAPAPVVVTTVLSASTTQISCHMISLQEVGGVYVGVTVRVTRNDAVVNTESVAYRAIVVGTVDPPE